MEFVRRSADRDILSTHRRRPHPAYMVGGRRECQFPVIRNGWLGENLGVWHRETPAKVGPLYDLYSAIAAITSEMKEIPMAIHARALAGLLSRRRISRIPVM